MKAHRAKTLQETTNAGGNPDPDRKTALGPGDAVIASVNEASGKLDMEPEPDPTESETDARAESDPRVARPVSDAIDSAAAYAEPESFEIATRESPEQPEPERAQIVAHVDGIDLRGNITGWGWAPDNPEQRLDVNAYLGNEMVSFGTANLPRSDVREAGHGDGCYGFSLPLSGALLDGTPRRFLIRLEASGLTPLVVEAELAPTRLAPQSSPRQTASAVTTRLQTDFKRAPSAVIYVPGQYIVCSSHYPPPPYHIDGWYEPEEEFTWIRGTEAVMEMLIRRPRESYTFALDLIPNGVGGRLQTIEIFFNYLRVGFFEVAEPMTASVELPSEIFTLRKARINLHCANALNPSDHGVADNRRLGIAVASWSIG